MDAMKHLFLNASTLPKGQYNIFMDTHPPNETYFVQEHMEAEESFVFSIKTMRNICIPLIVIVGVFGNFVSMLIFASNSLRRSSSSTFLFALACVDNIFLSCLFLTWFDGAMENILSSVGICQIITYLTYISSFLSVWFVVGFTLERYVAICHPLHAKLFCTQVRERITVLTLLMTSLLLYNFSLWTTDLEVFASKGIARCTIDMRYVNFLNFFTWLDTFLTMMIPFVLICYMNIRVAWTAVKFQEKRKACLSPRDAKSVKLRTLRSKQQMRVTRTLLLVSTTFLVLNLPSHVFKLSSLISESLFNISMTQHLIQEISQILYYFSFSMNFFLYAFYGKHFQRSLSFMYESLKWKSGCSDRMEYLERTVTLRSWV